MYRERGRERYRERGRERYRERGRERYRERGRERGERGRETGIGRKGGRKEREGPSYFTLVSV